LWTSLRAPDSADRPEFHFDPQLCTWGAR